MTTHYGERPGLEAQVAPRTMSAEQESGLRGITAHESSHVRAVLAELDAERAAHARALDVCERALAFMETMQDADNVELTPALRAVIAAARGERGAS